MECLSSRREREAPGGRARENRKFIQAPSPEIWSETISGGVRRSWRGNGGGLFLGYLLGRNYRRRDRDHLVPPMQQSAVPRCAILSVGSTGVIGQRDANPRSVLKNFTRPVGIFSCLSSDRRSARPCSGATEQRDELAACHWPMPPGLPIERIARLSYGRRLLRCLAYDIRFSCGKPL